MKNIIIVLSLTLVNLKIIAQKSFEGSIKFKTEISSDEINFKQKLDEKYGDSLIVLYSNNGNLKRQYLNSSNTGNEIQIYDPKKGVLFTKNRDSQTFNEGDVKINSIVKFISKKKINNETIMNLDCECFEYIGVSKYNQNVILNYCFSIKTPELNYILFEKHNDFFLNEFFETSQRPYLKFSIETETFKIVQTATKILEEEIESKIFEIK